MQLRFFLRCGCLYQHFGVGPMWTSNCFQSLAEPGCKDPPGPHSLQAVTTRPQTLQAEAAAPRLLHADLQRVGLATDLPISVAVHAELSSVLLQPRRYPCKANLADSSIVQSERCHTHVKGQSAVILHVREVFETQRDQQFVCRREHSRVA